MSWRSWCVSGDTSLGLVLLLRDHSTCMPQPFECFLLLDARVASCSLDEVVGVTAELQPLSTVCCLCGRSVAFLDHITIGRPRCLVHLVLLFYVDLGAGLFSCRSAGKSRLEIP